MKILITGICGFVGSSLVRAFDEAGITHELIGVDNLSRPGSEVNQTALRSAGVRVHHADIRSPSDFESLPEVDWVIDAAANPGVLAGVDGRTSSRQLVEHNLLGTVNILEYCKRVRAGFILLSTSRVYSIAPLAALDVDIRNDAYQPVIGARTPAGLSAAGLSEDFSTASPVSLYGATKLASEALALEYGQMFELPVWINRCGVLAGAGQFGQPEQGIFAYWIHAWRERAALRYLGFEGRGLQVRDVLHPRDLISLLQSQMTCSADGRERILNVSGGAEQSMSLRQLSTWCERRFGGHEVGEDPTPRPYDVPWMVLSTGRAKAAFDWQPKTGLEDILREIADYAETHPDWLAISAPR